MITDPGWTRVRPQDADVRPLLEQALDSLQAAVESVHEAPEAALDDLLAARLLVSSALLALRDAAADGSSPQ